DAPHRADGSDRLGAGGGPPARAPGGLRPSHGEARPARAREADHGDSRRGVVRRATTAGPARTDARSVPTGQHWGEETGAGRYAACSSFVAFRTAGMMSVPSSSIARSTFAFSRPPMRVQHRSS